MVRKNNVDILKVIGMLMFFLFINVCCGTFAQPYMMAYFSSVPGLHLAYSEDAENWIEIKSSKPFLVPDKGNSNDHFKDPSVCIAPDGTFHMVWTVWYHDSFGYSASKDLIHWTPQKRVRIMQNVATTKNVWAPEIFYDDKSGLFFVLWSSTIENLRRANSDKTNDKGWDHRIYYATTKDFKTYSEPKVYFDPSYTVIDATIIKSRRNKYMMLIKDERLYPQGKNIKLTYSKNLSVGFATELSAPLTNNEIAWAEGPAPLRVGKWIYVYYDKYIQGRYGAMRTRNGKRWKDVSEKCKFPKGMRHGSAFPVSREVLNKVLEATK